MKTYHILHLGIGNVGLELIKQIVKARKQIEADLNSRLIYCGLYTSKKGIYNKNGLDLEKELAKLKSREPLKSLSIDQAIADAPAPFILIDTTNSDSTFPYIKSTLLRDGFAVLSNKKPLAGEQKDFDALRKIGSHNLFFETVVGAGLPVMHTIKTLYDTGDEIIEIQGCFSGTLGFIFSELDRGALFSKTVLKAKQLGFTEPDPREDLSGRDVARKALILARLLGLRLEMTDIHLENLYPPEMQSLTPDEFLKQLPDLDKKYQEKIAQARKDNKVLRFVAKVNKEECKVGLVEVSSDSEIGRLQGPDNLITIKTKRYNNIPMVIKGPGAGTEVTAAGLFGDIIHILRKNI